MGKTYGVRLNIEAAAALEKEALRRGMKPTTLARELLLEGLSGGGETALHARLEAIEGTLVRIERDLPERLALTVAQPPPAQSSSEAVRSSSERAFHDSGGGLAAWVNGR